VRELSSAGAGHHASAAAGQRARRLRPARLVRRLRDARRAERRLSLLPRSADDRHPVYRFLEPRFADARAALAPQACTSCHAEHTGRRATVEPTACRHCHADIELQSDPVSTPHAELARVGAWDTCLGCHDFHGNHAITVPTALTDAASPAAIERYLAGGESPYEGEIRHTALQDNGTAQEERTWP